MAKPKKSKAGTADLPANAEEIPENIVHDGVLYEYFENDILRGYSPVVPPPAKMQPTVEWKGSKMEWTTYCQMISFFKWAFKETGGETQTRLAYNPTTSKWGIVVLPQKRSSGLSTEEIADHADRDAAMALLREGYSLVGTSHNHCAAAAFQSGTDRNDEIKQDGIHFTFWKLSDPTLDYHVRLTHGGTQYSSSLDYWVEPPECNQQLPGELQAKWNEYFLARPVDVAFPAEWKERVIRWTPPVTISTVSGGYNNGRCYGSWSWEGEKRKKEVLITKFPELKIMAEILAYSAATYGEVLDKKEALEELLHDAWREDHNHGEAKTFVINLEKRSYVSAGQDSVESSRVGASSPSTVSQMELDSMPQDHAKNQIQAAFDDHGGY